MAITRVARFEGISGPLLSANYFNGKYYLGNYGGCLISGPPWQVLDNSGAESYLDVCVFNNQLWMAVEGKGLYKLTNSGPVLVHADGYAFHLTVFKGELYFTHGPNITELYLSKVTLAGQIVRTYNVFKDGVFGDFLYVVNSGGGYIFLCSHTGDPYSNGGAKVIYSTDGVNFIDWSAVSGIEPVYRVYYWATDGAYYLGTWPTRDNWQGDGFGNVYRATSIGGAVNKVLASGKNNIPAIFAAGTKLYALASAGFNFRAGNTDAEESELYETSNGTSWTKTYTFAGDPEVSSAVANGNVIIFGGGKLNAFSSVYLSGELQILPPEPPTNVVAENLISIENVSGIRVHWTASTTTEVIGYTLYKYIDGVWDGVVVNVDTTYYFDYSISLHKYYYLVRSRLSDETLFSTWTTSNVYYAPYLRIPNEYLPFSLNITSTEVSENNYSITLTWNSNVYLDLSQTYYIEYSIDGGSFTYVDTVNYSTTNIYSYIHSNILPGHVYTYRISVRYLTWSSDVVFFTPITVVGRYLRPPTDIITSFDVDEHIELSWTDNTVGTYSHVIQKKVTNSIETVLADWTDLAIVPAGTITYTDVSATPAVIQQYRIASKDGIYISNYLYSGLLPEVPKIVNAVSAVVVDNSITITWATLEESAPIVSFVLEKRVDYGSWIRIDNIPATPVTYSYSTTDSDVVSGPGYTYRIYAVNGRGSSNYGLSNKVSILPVLFTTATPAKYVAATGTGRTIVIGKEGAGQIQDEIFGLASLAGYTWYTDLDGLGYMTVGVKSIDLITNKFGNSLSGGKTIYSVELVTDNPDEVVITAFSRQSDGKFHRVDTSTYMPIYSHARMIATGPEFKLRLNSLSANPKSFTIDKAIVWVKTTDRRGFNTTPQVVEQERYKEK